MSTHDPNLPDEGTTRWTAPTGPAISPLPPVEPSAAYDTPPTAPREMRDGLGMGPPAPQASMAYAFVDDLVVIGVDTSFVRAVIDTQPADSLASSAEYRRAVEAAGGASNGGVMYVDLGTSAMLADMLLTSGPMDGGMMDAPAREMRAVLGALESLVLVSRVEGDVALTRIVLSAREP
jgi:hypothetical protein